jgi:hypothetical protein
LWIFQNIGQKPPKPAAATGRRAGTDILPGMRFHRN